MRRWTLLLAGAALWLFLAAIPALADGGPHVAAVNNGSSSLTADSCAGCHRAHTASAPKLLNTAEEDLCLTCHGAQSSGATTDVMTGVQYVSGAQHDVAASAGTQLGALRNGGFNQARIGDPFRYTIDNGGSATRKAKVQVSATAKDVTSAHITMPDVNNLVQPGKAWGNGTNGSGVGPTVTLGCTSCHNPHGNGNFRILRSFGTTESGIPTGINAAWTASLVDAGVVTTTTYRTAASHGLNVGDTVTITGNSSTTANVTGIVATVPASNTFTLTSVTPGSGTGGIVTRSAALGVRVTDAPLDSDNNPANGIDNATKNYTVIQAAAPNFLLYASQVTTGPLTGDYLHRVVPWNALTGTNQDAPNGIPAAVGTQPAFNDQINAWCSTCHTRYLANQNPTTSPANGTVANSWGTPRAGDTTYMYQHRVRSDRACTTCHVSHGSNAVMDGTYSSTFTYPDGTTASASSRLLKVGNRGTCQMCHEPTGTDVIGNQYPPAPYPVPSTP